MFFNGFKSKEGVGAVCLFIDTKVTKIMISCRLEFECTNNIVEYKALVHGFKKAIDLGTWVIEFYGDSEIIVKK